MKLTEALPQLVEPDNDGLERPRRKRRRNVEDAVAVTRQESRLTGDEHDATSATLNADQPGRR